MGETTACEALVWIGRKNERYRPCKGQGVRPVEALPINYSGETNTPVVVMLCGSHQYQLNYMTAEDYPHSSAAIQHVTHGQLVGGLFGRRIVVSTPKRRLPRSFADEAVGDLYHQLLDAWNERTAVGFAAPFAEDGYVVGFDGSQMDGRAEIERGIGQIFSDHMTARYVGKIKEVRLLTPEVAVLRAVAGLAPRGQSDLNPGANAVQTLVASKREGQWQIAVYQNTPAQFHGRPDLAEQLTAELRELI